MKVKNLIESLVNLDPETEVILQKDSEGNGYSPLSGVDTHCVFVSGELYSTIWDPEDAGMSKNEWDEVLRRPRCVVLFPR